MDCGESLELGAKLPLSPADGQRGELNPKCVDLDCGAGLSQGALWSAHSPQHSQTIRDNARPAAPPLAGHSQGAPMSFPCGAKVGRGVLSPLLRLKE
jgi:hypothetical protein